jgi:hypothetical protein
LGILIQRFSDTEHQGTWVEPAKLDSIYFVLWQFCNNPISAILFIIGFGIFTHFSIKQKKANQQFISMWFWLPFLLMFFLSLPHKLCIPMFIERYVSFVAPALFIGIAVFVVKVSNEIKIKSGVLKFFPLIFILTICFGIKIKKGQNIFKQYSALKHRELLPTKTILQPYYGAFSYLYFNNRKDFKDFTTSKIYDHMENQLAKNNIYTSRKESLNYYQTDTTKSIMGIEGELNRKNEIFVIDSFLKSNNYLSSERIIESGKNCKIFIKQK